MLEGEGQRPENTIGICRSVQRSQRFISVARQFTSFFCRHEWIGVGHQLLSSTCRTAAEGFLGDPKYDFFFGRNLFQPPLPPRLTPGKVMRRTLRMQPSPLSSPSFPGGSSKDSFPSTTPAGTFSPIGSVGGSPTVQGSPILAGHGIMNEVGSHPQQRTSTPYSVGRQLLAYDAANKALDRHKAIFNRRVDKIKGWQMAEETAAAARARAKRKGKPLHYDRKTQPEVGRFYHMEGDEVQPLMSPTSLAKSKAALRISRRVPLTPQRKQKRQKTPPRKAITPRTLAHEAATKARALRRTRKRKFVRVKKT